MMAPVFFEVPYNWCDSNCHRCALHNVCKVALTNDRRRWRREARGKDPDALPFVLEDMSADLHTADSMLQQAARERGIDLSSSLPSPPSVLSTERLKRAILKLSRRVFELEVAGGLDRERAAKCLQLCLLLAGKTARVTSYWAGEFPEALARDAVPNLLLIELTLTRLHQVLEPLAEPQTSSALHDVQRLLAPLLETVDDVARAHLMELVDSGLAPSPFLVTDAECEAT